MPIENPNDLYLGKKLDLLIWLNILRLDINKNDAKWNREYRELLQKIKQEINYPWDIEEGG